MVCLNENSELKPVKLHIKIDFVQHHARAGWGKYIIWFLPASFVKLTCVQNRLRGPVVNHILSLM